MVTLVVYASVHGSTREIAERIGAALRERGVETAVATVDGAGDIASYEAVVLGSAIHGGRWLPEAEEFVTQHAAAMHDRPVWLFSVSSVGASSSALGPTPKNLAELRARTAARDHRAFAGVVRPEHWGRVGGIALRLMGGRYGDHRDWADIDRWASNIARELQADERSAVPRPTT
jgi:menaquinone-dependent protoporphyrinogen oxidase